MERVVVRIQRGVTAGKYRARFENYGRHILVGVADTEAEAWALFNDFTEDFPDTINKKKAKDILVPNGEKDKKLTKEDWIKISKEQIKTLSAKYK